MLNWADFQTSTKHLIVLVPVFFIKMFLHAGIYQPIHSMLLFHLIQWLHFDFKIFCEHCEQISIFSADSFSSVLQVLSSKGDEEGRTF